MKGMPVSNRTRQKEVLIYGSNWPKIPAAVNSDDDLKGWLECTQNFLEVTLTVLNVMLLKLGCCEVVRNDWRHENP